MSRSDVPRRLAAVGEDELLAEIFPLLSAAGQSSSVLVGPGDDTAVLAAPDGRVVATTDAMVRGRDWRDDWSTGLDVGHKVAAQNLADVAAMGAVPTGLLVTLLADSDVSVDWAFDLSRGIADEAARAGAAVVGGDLGSAGPGVLVVSVTALGDLQGRSPVLRSGARPGDVVAVRGSLGRAAAGLALLFDGRGERSPDLVGAQRRPTPPYAAGPEAADAGAHAMLDISDGLARDAGRIARASGVAIDLDSSALSPDVAALTPALGREAALGCVVSGGEEHSLLACFDPVSVVPHGWRVVGHVRAGAGVTLDGREIADVGWDHFGG